MRILILGALHWIAISSKAFKIPTKISILSKFFCFLLTVESSKITSNYEVTKQIKVFQKNFCLLKEGSGSRTEAQCVQIITDPDLGDPKNTDPMDPGPE